MNWHYFLAMLTAGGIAGCMDFRDMVRPWPWWLRIPFWMGYFGSVYLVVDRVGTWVRVWRERKKKP